MNFFFGHEPEQRRALLFALFATLLFISIVVSIQRPMAGEKKLSPAETWSSVPSVPPPPPLPVVPEVKEMNEKFVPDYFKDIDFWNRSYGTYRLSGRKIIDLTLKDGEMLDDDHRGWFSLKDVYYADVTGDGREEAIAILSHVRCSVSCEGEHLFYVYTMRKGKLKRVWQYDRTAKPHKSHKK